MRFFVFNKMLGSFVRFHFCFAPKFAVTGFFDMTIVPALANPRGVRRDVTGGSVSRR